MCLENTDAAPQKLIENARNIKEFSHDGLCARNRFIERLSNENVALQIIVPT
jgi:hypothetical protein